jgi:3-hydroxyacyl-CoA dehydrogenase
VKRIERVVVLGANGAMGAGSGETFAAAGITTTFLARDRDKAERGRARAVSMAKSEAISRYIRTGGYEELPAAVRM